DRRRRDAALLYLYADPEHPLSGATLTIDGRTRGALPGTVPVDPGRHQLTVRTAEGHVLVDGYVDVDGGRAYRVDQLVSRVQGEHGGFETRAIVVAMPGLQGALGELAGGVELGVDGRPAPLTARGLVLGGRVALAA